MTHRNQFAIFGMATDELRTFERKVSHQKLVKDEVLFRPSRDQNTELREAIRHLDASRLSELVPQPKAK